MNLKTIRLPFLDIGPKIENLEFFENLENLYLNNNNISRMGINSLQFNINIQSLNLSDNQIEIIEGIDHLNNLANLNLSGNFIVEYNPLRQFPKEIVYLQMQGNPVEKSDPDYRKKGVLALELLLEFDRLKVVQAERMTYSGLLPKSVGFNVEKNL